MPTKNHPLSPEQLMGYLDGELSLRGMAEAAEHLLHCRDCQALAASFQTLSSDLREWQIETAILDTPQLPKQAPASKGFHLLPQLSRFWARYRLQLSAGLVVLLLVFGFSNLSRPVPNDSPLRMLADQAPSLYERIVTTPPMGETPKSHNFIFRPPYAARSAAPAAAPPPRSLKVQEPIPTVRPLIARTALLKLTVTEFASVRDSIVRIVGSEQGYVSRLEINSMLSTGQTLTATLQIPAQRLDATLQEFKHLGPVQSEMQTGEDVSKQVVDVEARLANLRTEETRLNQLLKQRTGELADVLAVEEQISNVRGEIETAAAEQKNLSARVAYASLELTVTEEYRKALAGNETSTLTRLHNATIEGIEQLENLSISALVFLLTNGPSLLILAALCFLAFKVVERYRRSTR